MRYSLSAFFYKNKKLTHPYGLIHKLPFDSQGWFYNAYAIKQILNDHPIQTVIEVGSWLGSSTRFFAKLLPKKGRVYAIDTWLGSVEHQGNKKLGCLYHQFLSNIIHEKLTEKVIPIRMSSLEAAHAVDVKADLIYIDASHEQEDVYNDIMHWYPHLKQKGLMCGDDWEWESVKKAVLDAAFILKQEVMTHQNFWWFQPL